MKLLPLIVSAVFIVVALVLTIALANSTPTQQEANAFMGFYEGNRRFDGVACNTPLVISTSAVCSLSILLRSSTALTSRPPSSA